MDQMAQQQKIIDCIHQLPSESLLELSEFLAYLQWKAAFSAQAKPRQSGLEFLHSIVGLGADDLSLSECDEAVLASELHPSYGWKLEQKAYHGSDTP